MIHISKDGRKWRICYAEACLRGGKRQKIYFLTPKGHILQKGKYAKKLPEDYEIIEINNNPIIKRKYKVIEDENAG